MPLTPRAEYLLFAADRAQHFDTLIIPHLRNNAVIISDRMADSSLVYQGFGRGLDMAMLMTINQWAMHNVKPDLVFYVKIDPQVACARLAQRVQLSAFEQEKETFVHALAHGFDTLFKDRPDVVQLDGTQAPEQLTHQATHAVITWLTTHAHYQQPAAPHQV